MARFNDAHFFGTAAPGVQVWAAFVAAPAPGITKPERRQNVQRRRHRPAICRGRANQDIVHRIFCVVDLDVEEPAFQRSSVPKFKLAFHL